MNISQLYTLMQGDALNESIPFDYSRQAAVKEALAITSTQAQVELLKKIIPNKIIDESYDAGIDPITKKRKLGIRQVEVTPDRIPIDFANYVTDQRSTLTCGAGIGLEPSDEDSELFKLVKLAWDDMKLEFDMQAIHKTRMDETQVALYFFTDSESNFKYKIFSPSRGDRLTPIFDNETDDMIAFRRDYSDGYSDIYIKNNVGKVEIHKYKDDLRTDTIQLPWSNLPIIYWEQKQHECFNIKEFLRSWEVSVSGFFEGAKYTADPILLTKGKHIELPQRMAAGKTLHATDDGANAEFITPPNATETRELQFRETNKMVHKLSKTAALDFNSITAAGSSMSGRTIELMMTDSYMAATREQNGEFGKGVQRVINWLLKEIRAIHLGKEKDLRIKPVFRKYSLTDENDRAELYMKINGNLPLISHEESISNARFSSDTEATKKALIN